MVVPSAFKIGSGKSALLAIDGTTQEKFWNTHDALSSSGRKNEPISTKAHVKETDIPFKTLPATLFNPRTNRLLTRYIRQGIKLPIADMPAFVINGGGDSANIPSQILPPALQ